MARMEIGTHTQHHLPLDTLSDSAQIAELAQSKQVAERLLGKPVLGFRPPEERFWLSTLQAWADLGGTYVFVNNNMRSAGPEIIPVLPDSLVMLGRVSEDDFEILDRDHIRDRREMSRVIITQVREAEAYRGLYMFSYHSHMFAQRDLVSVLQVLADKLKHSPQIWTTTAGQVAAWWRKRSYIDVVGAADGLSATVVNRGTSPFSSGVLLIESPAGGRRTVALPIMQPGAALRVYPDGRTVAVSGASATAGTSAHQEAAFAAR
jgi:hypothetical protein